MIWTPSKKIALPKYQRGSVGAFAGGIMVASSLVDVSWSPIIYGRVDADGYVVYANDTDFQLSPTDSYANERCALMLIKTSDNCYIRCGRWAVGDGDAWYNTGGTGQGDPGYYLTAPSDVFELGTVPDSVNIYNKLDTTTSGVPTFHAMGSYTSDDKSTFFNPTQDVDYGRYIYCQAVETGFGFDLVDGQITLQFTFRKAGETDYTVTFRGRGRARAEVDI